MDFRIADTFTDSLARLTGDEQKAVKTTAFDLQLNPASPGMQLHKLDKAKDKRFWSVRVNADVRLILHRTETSMLLCYVDHHDKAYTWAERRKLETHPTTGAAQLVEIRETVKEITVPKYVEQIEITKAKKPKPLLPLFAELDEAELLSYGVPAEWMADVRAATEETLFPLCEHLPKEAAEALLEVATGGTPVIASPAKPDVNPFDHPDAQRRFRVMTNVEELQRALDYPWEQWTIFLHPAQRELVERDYNGPARVAGSAGTGKTIVALHRAVHLAKQNPDARVLLTTFSEPLANLLRTRVNRLISNEPRIAERLEVHAITAIGQRLHEIHVGKVRIASDAVIRKLLAEAASQVKHQFTEHFLWTEWSQVVDAWQLESWEAYRDVVRLGRKRRLSESQRELLWSICERLRQSLKKDGVITQSAMFRAAAEKIRGSKRPPFDFVVVDEAQDISIQELRFLAAMGNDRPNSLFFAGDLGQRIFQQPFSWKSLGVDIRGRSRTLRINYRTSHQIRIQTERLLSPEITDVDGNVDDRRETISVFNGPKPAVRIFASEVEEIVGVSEWIREQLEQGVQPSEIGVFVRSPAQYERLHAALNRAGLKSSELTDRVESLRSHASYGVMHRAKGLEFRAVVVMACDDEVIPLQERVEAVTDDSDLAEVYDTERQLLYVACTRARDNLFVTGVEPASEFLEDLK